LKIAKKAHNRKADVGDDEIYNEEMEKKKIKKYINNILFF
jgi:hypothetical protein